MWRHLRTTALTYLIVILHGREPLGVGRVGMSGSEELSGCTPDLVRTFPSVGTVAVVGRPDLDVHHVGDKGVQLFPFPETLLGRSRQTTDSKRCSSLHSDVFWEFFDFVWERTNEILNNYTTLNVCSLIRFTISPHSDFFSNWKEETKFWIEKKLQQNLFKAIVNCRQTWFWHALQKILYRKERERERGENGGRGVRGR